MKVEKITSPEAFAAWAKQHMNPVEQVNWPAGFPGKPEVAFAIARSGEDILILFRVKEEATLGRVEQDNGPVWTDSCVEFFISLGPEGYYNFEFNCLGTLLLAFGPERGEGRIKAPAEVLSQVERHPSLGRAAFGLREGAGEWTMQARIPMSAFFRHDLKTLDGMTASANFYKCGDDLPQPHFLSWQPIDTPNPDFHRPEFFGPLTFE